ncbi:MAG: 2Fe-2S iron-sulfur cluster-binding protein [Pyrobaculum sp.]
MRYVVYIRRKSGEIQYTQRYVVETDPRTSVLDLLINLREDVDGTIAFRYACRMGVCGICAVKINGVPKLACATKLSDLNTYEIYIEPISDRVIKDLVADVER